MHNSSYAAWAFLHYLTMAIPLLFAGMYIVAHATDVSPGCREAYLNLILACGLIIAKTFTKQQLAVMVRRVILAQVLVEQRLPCCEQDMKLHSLDHAPKRILGAGPLLHVAAWVYESMWKRFMSWAANKAHPEVSMLHKFADLELGNMLHLRDPELFSSSFRAPIVLDGPRSELYIPSEWSRQVEEGVWQRVEVGQGKKSNVALTEAQKQALHDCYVSANEEYRELWESYTRYFFVAW